MSQMNYYFIGPLETKDLSSDNEGDCMEDTFRPSLFQRIDSSSSLQSLEAHDFNAYEQSIPQINISGMSKKEDREIWDVSMLYSVEHEKALELDLQLKNTEAKVAVAERKERRIVGQLEEAKTKIMISAEQHTIELDYLNTKIELNLLNLSVNLTKLNANSVQFSSIIYLC